MKREKGNAYMELVSVIIPVYNVRDYLEKCVDSVLAQTYPCWEIVLVDDGSTDGSGQMCDKIMAKDKRIQVIHKENGGLSDARNAGVEKARGKYLCFLDSDDSIEADMLERTVNTAEKYHSDMVFFDYKRLEPGGQVNVSSMELKEENPMNLHTDPEILLTDPSACMKLYLREFYVRTKIKFPKGYRYEDLGTIPKLLLHAENIVYIKKAFYRYLIREGSITTGTDSEQNYLHRKKMIEGVLDYYKNENAFQEFAPELEYLTFYHMYFLPAKEIIYGGGDTSYIKKCRAVVEKTFPLFRDNPYIRRMSGKERIQWKFIGHEMFWAVRFLSWLREKKEIING